MSGRLLTVCFYILREKEGKIMSGRTGKEKTVKTTKQGQGQHGVQVGEEGCEVAKGSPEVSRSRKQSRAVSHQPGSDTPVPTEGRAGG